MNKLVCFESILERVPGKGGLFYIMVPEDVAAKLVSGRRPERIRCCLNDLVEFQCAIRPKGGGGFYINVGGPVRKEGRFMLGQKLSAVIQKDDSEFGRDVPEELAELFSIDEEGRRLFLELLPGQQRGIIHYIASAKSIQVRIDRAIMMIDRLKVGKVTG